jgi:phosphoribosyl-dephospho-CoA transferase
MNLKRHTFVDISDAGREVILAELTGSGTDSRVLRETYRRVILPQRAGCRIPGVVRREDGVVSPGYLPVGFSELQSAERRLRLAAFARVEDVTRIHSPYEIASLPIPRLTACTRALALAKAHAESLHIPLGVWGSVAMELYTGFPCIRPDSDLDVIIGPAPLEHLSRFMDMIKDVEEHFALRVDAELDLPSGYGIQLKELFARGRTVLGKSMTAVDLLQREEVLAELPRASSTHVLGGFLWGGNS